MTLFLAGPTGSGKSAVAVELAEMLDAEIVSSDAYQVYRELPILTAAPSPADRERVPHHMVSIIPVHRNWNATEHYHRAMRCMEEIRARGKIAIVTGGSGLYFKFLSHGLSEAPPGDAALRAAFANCSTEALYARLSSLDRKERPRRMPPTGVMWNAIWKSSLPEGNRFPSGRGTGWPRHAGPAGSSAGMSLNWTEESPSVPHA